MDRLFLLFLLYFLVYSPEIPSDLFVQFALSLALFVLIPLSHAPPPLLITGFISVQFFITENKWTKNPSYTKSRMLIMFPIFHNYSQCTTFCMCIFMISEVYFQGKFLEVGLLCERIKGKHKIYRCAKVIFVGIGSFFPPTSNPCKCLFPIASLTVYWRILEFRAIQGLQNCICVCLHMHFSCYNWIWIIYLYLRTILYLFLWNMCSYVSPIFLSYFFGLYILNF